MPDAATQGLLADEQVLDALASGTLDSSNKSTVYLLRKNGRTSLAGTVFNFVCVCVGAGILGLPGALKTVGWFGLFLMALVAFVSNSTAKMLIACIHAPVPEGVKIRCYEDIGAACYGKVGRVVVGTLQSVTLMGVATIFLVLIGGNMSALVTNVSFKGHVWVFIFGSCLIPVAWLKTMKEISFLALFGVFSSATVATTIFFKGLIDGTKSSMATTSFFIGDDLPNAFNTIVFSFGFHAVLPHIEMMMDKREEFPTVSNISCSIIFAIYALSSAAAYYCYGSSVNTEHGILANMGDSDIVQIARALITAHVFFAYPLPLNPVSIAVESALKISRMTGSAELTARIVVRTLLVLFTMFVASVVPYFGDLLNIVSAVSTSLTAFIFPPVFYYVLYTRAGVLLSVSDKLYLLFITTLGALAFSVGTYYAFDGLIDSIKNHPNPFEDFWHT
jgi:vesicular inhibitory amino acid transporter